MLSGCSIQPNKNSNACYVLTHHQSWYNSLSRSEKKYNIPKYTTLAIIAEESNFISNAKPRYKYFLGLFPYQRISTAEGYSQALNATWKDYQRSTGRKKAVRQNFDDASDFIGWYLNKASKNLSISKNDTKSLYLAYHEGINGYKKKNPNFGPNLNRVATRVKNRNYKYIREAAHCQNKLTFWQWLYFWDY
ncbi:MAG: transglycosylase [Legionellales bacterium]|nr:transglycosylase [Legionellales bacterium]|tara:strand:- start:282 stop:854 length:573 start_codon:yes stop_codon:yes gene_type:complete